MAARYLLDTNILLRLAHHGDPAHGSIRKAIQQILAQAGDLFYSPQNIVEFWNVTTRPAASNGFGLSIAEAEYQVRLIERGFTLLPDNERIHSVWRRLVNDHGVHGRQVHDARLVAAMYVHDVPNLLTLNRADFIRYTGIAVIDPANA